MRMRVSGFVSAVCLGVVLTTIASTAAAVRTVDLSLTLPGGERPQLTIAEGNTGTIEIGDQKLGFVPKFDDGSSSAVTISIYDLAVTPNRKLTGVRLTVGGDAVRTTTKPELLLSVPRIHGA